jgi:CBS domain containing-hemolysin-like protein
LYQKEDMVELINQQQVQTDNRITEEELRIATHALTYGGKIIRDVMTPRRMMRSVSADDVIGPILMTELHKSGHSRFPVMAAENQAVGMLYVRDLVAAKQGGKVSELMEKHVYYVQEEQSLDHALQAFLRTKHHLFLVINEFEEIVGLISIEDVLEQVLGKKILDEFDQYDDLRAVAKLRAKEARHDRVGEVIE